jgi:pyruvate kinase
MQFRIDKKTKIVATIGPASETYETFLKLIEAGMNVMRVNFSHGDYPSHLEKINLARRVEKEYGIHIPVMLDSRGPEIRVGMFEEGFALIEQDSIIRISMTPVLGHAHHFSVSYAGLYGDVKIGDLLKIDDGNLALKIIEKDAKTETLVCRALNTHTIKNRKGLNAPFARLSMPFISEQDEKDLKFGCEENVDYVAASFTRRRQDVLDIKDILKKYGKPNIQVIAKIENPEGVSNLEEILDVADGIMVARGDLGVEIAAEQVPIVQKRIVTMCRKVGKPVITATQMLDSMVSMPRPTRAEVSDVANAILESTDAVMLSAESASGKYPIEATAMQANIAATMEKELDYVAFSSQAFESSRKVNSDAIANSVANTAYLINADAIVTFTETGGAARRIAKTRPYCPIIAISDRRETVTSLGLIWGIYSYFAPSLPQFIEEMEAFAILKARQLGLKPGSHIILAGGVPTGVGSTNFMKILTLKELNQAHL